MAYGDFKILKKKTFSDKILRDKTFNIAKRMMNIKQDQLLWFINFFDKKSEGSRIVNNKENIQLAEELHKPIIKNFEKREMYSSFRDNTWGADLADMDSY